MGRKEKGGGSLGSALKKDKNKLIIKKSEYIKEHKAEDVNEDLAHGKKKLISVVERAAVDDFLYNAELKQQKFDAVKQRKLITTDSIGTQVVIDLSTKTYDGPSDDQMKTAMKEMELIKLPRRPAWDGKRTGKDQRLLENTVFVDWRRDLAALEEKYRFVHVTPYEKNIEIWKQLWMVIEKSDILVQIVDCRDPQFFRNIDLERYVKEVGEGKINFLLLNKADLLDEEMRKVWSDYFNEKKVNHIFFSAKQQQTLIDQDIKEEETTDISGLINTSKVVTRSALKTILKSIVNDYRTGKNSHWDNTADLKPQETVKEETPIAVIPNPDAQTTSTQPPKKLKILKVVTEEEIKGKPVVNLQDAIDALEDNDHSHGSEGCGHESCEECRETETKPLDEIQEKPEVESKPPTKPAEDESGWVDDDAQGSDGEGEEEQEEGDVDIYTKLGVDRHNLVSKPFFDKRDENQVVIGMIGFPNVGKSSVINVLCDKKLVGVGARPGKTKNFQTIFLEKDLVLCDCPGLVFPSIAHSKEVMIVNSVIALENMKDYMAPIHLVCKRIPARVMEYALKCPLFSNDKYIEGGRLLHVFANNRGMISGSGMPNYAEAAKFILRRYMNGDLLYVNLPPGPIQESMKSHQYNRIPETYVQSNPDSIQLEVEKKYKEEDVLAAQEMDKDYFEPGVDVESTLEKLSQDDVFDLMMGKKLYGIKLDKIQRRELKFAIKRDADSEEIFGMLGSFIGKGRKSYVNTVKPNGA